MVTCDQPEQAAQLLRGSPVWEMPPAPDFTLTDQHRQPFRLSDQRGRIVLLFFGYVQCPDVCPATLSTWGKLERALGDDAERVCCVFVTVDPERDTPERLEQHLQIYSKNVVGLTGSLFELQPIWDAYQVHRQRVTLGEGSAAYLIDHSPRMLLIDQQGLMRLRYEFGTPAESLLADLSWLLEH